ncbi:FtsX-like permease family protein [Caulobacter segnis]
MAWRRSTPPGARARVGLRKVLGASREQVAALLIGQFLRPILVACLVAWPLAYWALRRWLSQFDRSGRRQPVDLPGRRRGRGGRRTGDRRGPRMVGRLDLARRRVAGGIGGQADRFLGGRPGKLGLRHRDALAERPSLAQVCKRRDP